MSVLVIVLTSNRSCVLALLKSRWTSVTRNHVDDRLTVVLEVIARDVREPQKQGRKGLSFYIRRQRCGPKCKRETPLKSTLNDASCSASCLSSVCVKYYLERRMIMCIFFFFFSPFSFSLSPSGRHFCRGCCLFNAMRKTPPLLYIAFSRMSMCR